LSRGADASDAAARVLLVEDDPGIARVVRNGLANHDMQVDWARGAGEAVERLARGSYAALILDLMLPDGDGYGLCRELRGRQASIPVCMLTARDTLDDKLEGFDAGADDYLTKPFAIDELAARLRVLIRRGADLPPARIEVGDLTVDCAAREVRVHDEELLLTPREFDILAFLAVRAGQSVARESLLDAVWQADRAVTPNSVDVYIGYLRKKLAAAGSSLRIEAVRGIGFKMR
jgi:DNA-binding response OmpR family regulator